MVSIDNAILKKYEIIEILKTSKNKKVIKAYDRFKKKLKIIKKYENINADDKRGVSIVKEILLLFCLKNTSEYINRLEMVYLLDNSIYYIFEYDFLDISLTIQLKVLNLYQIQFIVFQLVNAIKYLHVNNVYNNTIKPTSILLNDYCIIKLVNFYNCVYSCSSGYYKFDSYNNYLAPEILLEDYYNNKSELWGIGCLAYELFTGNMLFPGNNKIDYLTSIIFNIGFPTNDELKSINSSSANHLFTEVKIMRFNDIKTLLSPLPEIASDFISKILVYNPNKRISIEECLKHKFINQFNTSNTYNSEADFKIYNDYYANMNDKNVDSIIGNLFKNKKYLKKKYL